MAISKTGKLWHEGQAGLARQGQPAKKGRAIPATVIRQLAMASTEGGRFQCPNCRHSFAAYYGRWVENWKGDAYYCKDCARGR